MVPTPCEIRLFQVSIIESTVSAGAFAVSPAVAVFVGTCIEDGIEDGIEGGVDTLNASAASKSASSSASVVSIKMGSELVPLPAVPAPESAPAV